MLAIIVLLIGCVYIEHLLGPAATPIYAVTINPSPPPATTPVPTPVVTRTSTDVTILPLKDNGVANFSFDKGEDYEVDYITVVLQNDGSSVARNVTLSLTETDAHGGNLILQQKFNVGDMPRGNITFYTMKTDKHDPVSSVYMTVTIQWGANGEYVSPMKYLNIAKTIWR